MGTSRQRLTKDVGATGLVETWGYIKDDFLKEWTGQQKIKSIDEMLRNSSAVGANRYLMEQMLRGVTWYINSEEGEDDPRVELLNDALNNMTHSFDDHIVDVVLMPFYGFSVFTITYEFVGGRTYWRKFKMLGHDTIQQWLIAEDGGIEGLQQWPHLWPAPIPIERMLLYRFRKPLNNPEGESILRPAWTSWYYVKNLQNIEAISLERMGAGLPVITPPEGADMGGADGDNAELVVRNIRQDQQAGVVLPPPNGEGDHNKWHLELLSAAGTSMSDFDNVISRYEKRILMTTLSQFLMLGQDNVGALATFEGGDDLFTRSINSLADNIAATFTQYAIPRLLKLNGIDDANGIKLEHTPADSVDPESIAAFLQQAGTFVTWTPEDEIMLRDLLGLPEKSVEELEEVQEEDRARKAEAVRAFQERRGEVDENAAHYAVDRHPEDEAVSRVERKTGRYMAAFLREQQKEVTGDLDA